MNVERAEWDAFRLREFGEPYMVWHDGPSFEALIARCESDPNGVDRMLRVGLRQQDPLAADAIAVLALRGVLDGDFTPDLVAAMTKASGEFRVSTATALIVRTRQQEWAADIIEVLLSHASPCVRLDAARALALVEPSTAVIDALARAVSDADYLVRYHAANAMLAQSHTGTTVDKSKWLFSRIGGQASRSEWLEAARTLREGFPGG